MQVTFCIVSSKLETEGPRCVKAIGASSTSSVVSKVACCRAVGCFVVKLGCSVTRTAASVTFSRSESARCVVCRALSSAGAAVTSADFSSLPRGDGILDDAGEQSDGVVTTFGHSLRIWPKPLHRKHWTGCPVYKSKNPYRRGNRMSF